jgi:prepilin-type N-terminal cleavage/methylation domain-containing protein
VAGRRAQAAFTIVELAVVMAIIGLLLAGAMMTLSAQAEQRAIDETRRRLNASVDALLAYAVVNGRLPCPASSGTTGDESPIAGTGNCPGASAYNGFLPARTIGMQPTDSSFYALDAWNNRIRYAVSIATPTGCVGAQPYHFTIAANLKADGIGCKPNDLDVVCSTASAATSPSCNSGTHVVAQNTVAFVVYSIGKNGPSAANYGPDETENVNLTATYVDRPWSGTDSPLGTYDDLVVVVPAGVLYSRLVAAGVLP